MIEKLCGQSYEHVSRALGERGAVPGWHDFLRAKSSGGGVRQQRSTAHAELYNDLRKVAILKNHLSSVPFPLS